MKAETKIRRWNCKCPEGTEVLVTKDVTRGKTVGAAFVRKGEAVVRVEGIVWPVPLEMVRAAGNKR
jgi:hypothetical protein